MSIPDGRKGLDTEEERPQKSVLRVYICGIHQAPRSAQHKGCREDRVDAQIKSHNEEKEFCPGHGKHGLVRAERGPEREALTAHIEAAIAIEQPLAALARDHRRSEERRVGKEWRSRWAPYH